MSTERDNLRGTLSNSVCNTSLYPKRAQPYLLGGDMSDVLDRTADNLLAAGYRKPTIHQGDNMAAREQLAQSIATNLDRVFGKREFGPATQDYKLADALLAEGWGKPRTVATVEELDALPVGSVVQSYIGAIYERDCYGDDPEFPWWCETADSRQYPSRRVSLPATVLYEPQP